MELQRNQNTSFSIKQDTSSTHSAEQTSNLSIDDRINQISQQFWQELNDTSATDLPLLGMWK